jgi:hypothetical protein
MRRKYIEHAAKDGMIHTQGKVFSPASYAEFRGKQKQQTNGRYKAIVIQLNFEKDANLLDYLHKQRFASTYIKRLIEKDVIKNEEL